MGSNPLSNEHDVEREYDALRNASRQPTLGNIPQENTESGGVAE